ncbi:MAG: helix-turn-helix transcriptional regulator [Anaerolineales bacterium]|nr:helix-turn-helix transcriptional regulator [Anaerolineales bacterium]
MTKRLQIQEELIIDDLEVLKVISDPLRVRIVELISVTNRNGQLCTVKQLAEKLDMPPTKLYYHINLLEKHGLIEIAETEVVSGIVEKRYQVAAYRMRVSASIIETHDITKDEQVELALNSVQGVIDSTMDDLRQSIAYLIAQDEQDNPVEQVAVLVSRENLRLTRAQAEELQAKMEKLVDEYKTLDPTSEEDPLIFGLTIALNPNYHLGPDEKGGRRVKLS